MKNCLKKLNRWKNGLKVNCMKVNINKTKVMISEESLKEYIILKDSHVVFVIEVLVQT